MICSSIEDLPIPGSPPTSVTDPFTIPPPSTRSNSDMLVDILECSLPLISASAVAFEILPANPALAIGVFLDQVLSLQ